MVLPFLIPIIGAAIGGGIAASVGGAILTGMSIGWMVGSWLFPMGGDSGIEPTAANLQDVNQSLRGADIPILFGTNRVQSAIILRDNFDTDKIKEDSGGFFGIGGGSETVGYEYYLDMILYYGIPYTDTGFQIFAGWRNDEIISARGLSRFTQLATGDHPLVTEATYRSEITKFLNQPSGAAGRGWNFRSAHWSGGRDDAEVWSRVDDLTGHRVRWPHQVWVGFENFRIEANATIPALSFEIGPSGTAGELTPGEGDGLVSVLSLNTSNNAPGRNLDKYGNTWLWGDSGMRCISASGTVLYLASESGWIDRMNEFTGTASFFSYSSTRRGFANVCPILNGEKVAIWFKTFTGPDADYQLSLSIVDPISDVGTPTIDGLVWCRDALQGASRGGTRGFDHAHLQREQDPLLYHGAAENTLTVFYSYVFPDPQGIMNGAYANGYGASTVGLAVGTTAVWTSHEVPRIRYFLPTAADRSDCGAFWDGIGTERVGDFVFMLPMDKDGAIRTALWVPIIKGVHDHNVAGSNQWNAYTNSISLLTSAHLGGAVYYLFDNHEDGPELTYPQVSPPSGSLGSKVWDFFADTWVLASSHFLNAQGQITIPFSDDQRRLDGTAVDASNASYAPHPFFHKDDDSTWCFGWKKYYVTSPDTLGNKQFPLTIRGYIYNRESGIFTLFGTDTRTQTAVRTTVVASILDFTNRVYLGARVDANHQLFVGGSDSGNRFFNANWGTFDCSVSSHTDLTPPEIIRHILVNSLYGLNFPSTRIHSSYDAAVAYCNSENFRISGIYRTSEDRARYVEHLLATYGGYLVWSRGQLKFGVVTGSDSVVRTLDNAHFAVQKIGDVPLKVMKGSRQDTFNKIQVHYLDRRLAYRTNMVEIADEADIDETGVRVREFPARFVMGEEMATKIAHRTLWSNLFARDQYQGAFGWKDADLEPGDVVWLVDSLHPELDSGVRARIIGIAESAPGFFVFNAVQEDPAFLNDPGFVASETLASPGAGVAGAGQPLDFIAFETPQEFAPASEIYFAMYPNNAIIGSALYTSASSDGTFSLVTQNNNRPVAGRIGLGLSAAGEFRHEGSLLFLAASGHTASSPSFAYTLTYSSVLPDDRANGNAIMLCGSEVIAVESLTATGSNQYRASRVYRGWGGTPIHAHNSGDVFYWLDSAILARPYVVTEVGKLFFYKVAEVDAFGETSEIASITPKEYRIRGTWYGPQVSPPLHTYAPSEDVRGLTTFGVNSGDDIRFAWEPSARLAGFGAGAFGNAGFGHFTTDPTSQRWHVEITGSGGNVVRSLVVTTPSFVYSYASNIADNGAFGPFAIRVTAHNDVTSALRSQVKSCSVFRR